jgi:HlyD family secretion protein
MRNILTSRPAIGVLFLVLLAGAGIVVWMQRGKSVEYEVSKAVIANLAQEVTVTGRVKPADAVELAFEIPGKVAGVFFEAGNSIEKGQTLVRLDDAELQAELVQAKAKLEVEVAILAELQRGTRFEEIEAAEKNVVNVEAKAAADIQEAYAAALAASQKAVRAAKNALLVLTDIQFVQFLGNDQSSTSVRYAKADALLALFASKDGGAASSESLSALAGGVFGEIQILKTKDAKEIDAALVDVLFALAKVRDALKAVPIISSVTALQRADLGAEEFAIGSEIVTVSAKQQAIGVVKAQNASLISSAKEDLVLKKAGSTPEEIASQEARVRSAEAAVETTKTRVAKTRLISPLQGVLSKQKAKVGEFVRSGDIVLEVISQTKFDIETNVPEADIAKITVGHVANLTLDAYGESVLFEAVVVALDPAETIIEGVPTYRVTLHFLNENLPIRSGMTANITIVTAIKEQALVVPSRAVIDKEGKKMVRVIKDKNVIEQREVVLGLRGSDGNVEILQGIEAGEKVVTFVHD